MPAILGPLTWHGERDEEGYRDYYIEHLVMADNSGQGPDTIMQTPGLPIPGDVWGFDADSGTWVTCKMVRKVNPVVQNEPNIFWKVETKFSSKGDDKRCKDQQIDDPLLKPQEVSGSFVKYQEELSVDVFGKPIVTSSFERIKGPQTEFDRNRMSVKIQQNVPVLELDLLATMQDKLNDAPLWGQAAQTIKCSSISWERKFYGLCTVYYSRTFEFDVRVDGWERDILDEGTKCLKGTWDVNTDTYVIDYVSLFPPVIADNTNPAHFTRFKDKNGDSGTVILDGQGNPSGVDIKIGSTTYPASPPGQIHLVGYLPTNFLVLGIPITF
jgi:hypothetical protein